MLTLNSISPACIGPVVRACSTMWILRSLGFEPKEPSYPIRYRFSNSAISCDRFLSQEMKRQQGYLNFSGCSSSPRTSGNLKAATKNEWDRKRRLGKNNLIWSQNLFSNSKYFGEELELGFSLFFSDGSKSTIQSSQFLVSVFFVLSLHTKLALP